jgi:hypothetical protein
MHMRFIVLLVTYAKMVRIYASKIFIPEKQKIVKSSFWPGILTSPSQILFSEQESDEIAMSEADDMNKWQGPKAVKPSGEASMLLSPDTTRKAE